MHGRKPHYRAEFFVLPPRMATEKTKGIMMEKIKVALLAIIAVLLGGILFTLNMPQTEEPQAAWSERPPAWSENSLTECGMCGAHVMETWHTENSDGEIIHICWRCAELLDEE